MEAKPQLGSSEYQDEIFSKMYDGSEKITKKEKIVPKASGLWNVCIREIGLLECNIDSVQAPPGLVMDDQLDNLSSTVKATVTLTPYVGRYFPVNENIGLKIEDFSEDARILSNKSFFFQGLCDIGKYNTEPPFHRFCSATAESIALGRALKKAMALNCHTAEEISTDFDKLPEAIQSSTADGPITKAQAQVLNGQADKLNVDSVKYIADKFNIEGLDNLSKQNAEDLLGTLADWNTKGKVPAKYLLKDKK